MHRQKEVGDRRVQVLYLILAGKKWVALEFWQDVLHGKGNKRVSASAWGHS